MRNVLYLALFLCLARQGPALACDGAAEVEAAFAKQQVSRGWRTVETTNGAAGLQEQTSDYVPPDRMYRKVVVPGQSAPIETIGIGKLAWNNVGSGWDEMKAGYAQLVTTHIKDALATPPKASADFTCLGHVTFEGKDYIGYQTKPEKSGDGVELARTIYVDPATGLPAFNIIGAVSGGEPLVKQRYTYPADLSIERPY